MELQKVINKRQLPPPMQDVHAYFAEPQLARRWAEQEARNPTYMDPAVAISRRVLTRMPLRYRGTYLHTEYLQHYYLHIYWHVPCQDGSSSGDRY